MGRKMFCGRSCSGTHSNLASPRHGNANNLKADNRQDVFSPFRYYRNKARSTERLRSYGNTDLTLEYLKGLWEAQNGICPYTKKIMFLPMNTRAHNDKAIPNQASLDRIASSMGYVQGNVEFICLVANLAKNRFSKSQVMDFFSQP
jgi:hypothetical protein